MPPKFELHVHFTKSLKRDNIYKLCLLKLLEHNCVILTTLPCTTLRYRAHAYKCQSLLHCTESLKQDDIETYGL